jgi:hypothetical protein
VHPFWSSHEEKQACVRLSIGGQPWPELEIHGRPWGARRREDEGAQLGGTTWGGAGRRKLGAGFPSCSAAACCTCVLSVREEDPVGKKGKRRKRKTRG